MRRSGSMSFSDPESESPEHEGSNCLEDVNNLYTGDEVGIRNAPDTLLNLVAKYIAHNLPFEILDSCTVPVPEHIQRLIAYHSFPANEEDIFLYACINHGNYAICRQALKLLDHNCFTEAFQIGFYMTATFKTLVHDVGIESTSNNISTGTTFRASIMFDRQRITSTHCTCNRRCRGNWSSTNRATKTVPPPTTTSTSNTSRRQSRGGGLPVIMEPYEFLNADPIQQLADPLSRPKGAGPSRSWRRRGGLNAGESITSNVHPPKISPLAPEVGSVVTRNPFWCQHVVALCLLRIRRPDQISFRPPISESLSTFDCDDLQKILHLVMCSVGFKKVTPLVQRIIEMIRSPVPNSINSVHGAPDPTAGGSLGVDAYWCIDTNELTSRLKSNLNQFWTHVRRRQNQDPLCLDQSTVPRDVKMYHSVMQSLRRNEPRTVWNVMAIIADMLRRGDKNGVILLDIVTRALMQIDNIIWWWYLVQTLSSTKSANMYAGALANRYSTYWLCEEVVNLWTLTCSSPRLLASLNVETASTSPLHPDLVDLVKRLHAYHQHALYQIGFVLDNGKFNFRRQDHLCPKMATWMSGSRFFSSRNIDLQQCQLLGDFHPHFSGFKPALIAASMIWSNKLSPTRGLSSEELHAVMPRFCGSRLATNPILLLDDGDNPNHDRLTSLLASHLTGPEHAVDRETQINPDLLSDAVGGSTFLSNLSVPEKYFELSYMHFRCVDTYGSSDDALDWARFLGLRLLYLSPAWIRQTEEATFHQLCSPIMSISSRNRSSSTTATAKKTSSATGPITGEGSAASSSHHDATTVTNQPTNDNDSTEQVIRPELWSRHIGFLLELIHTLMCRLRRRFDQQLLAAFRPQTTDPLSSDHPPNLSALERIQHNANDLLCFLRTSTSFQALPALVATEHNQNNDNNEEADESAEVEDPTSVWNTQHPNPIHDTDCSPGSDANHFHHYHRHHLSTSLDCTYFLEWIPAARRVLDANPQLAVDLELAFRIGFLALSLPYSPTVSNAINVRLADLQARLVTDLASLPIHVACPHVFTDIRDEAKRLGENLSPFESDVVVPYYLTLYVFHQLVGTRALSQSSFSHQAESQSSSPQAASLLDKYPHRLLSTGACLGGSCQPLRRYLTTDSPTTCELEDRHQQQDDLIVFDDPLDEVDAFNACVNVISRHTRASVIAYGTFVQCQMSQWSAMVLALITHYQLDICKLSCITNCVCLRYHNPHFAMPDLCQCMTGSQRHAIRTPYELINPTTTDGQQHCSQVQSTLALINKPLILEPGVEPSGQPEQALISSDQRELISGNRAAVAFEESLSTTTDSDTSTSLSPSANSFSLEEEDNVVGHGSESEHTTTTGELANQFESLSVSRQDDASDLERADNAGSGYKDESSGRTAKDTVVKNSYCSQYFSIESNLLSTEFDTEKTTVSPPPDTPTPDQPMVTDLPRQAESSSSSYYTSARRLPAQPLVKMFHFHLLRLTRAVQKLSGNPFIGMSMFGRSQHRGQLQQVTRRSQQRSNQQVEWGAYDQGGIAWEHELEQPERIRVSRRGNMQLLAFQLNFYALGLANRLAGSWHPTKSQSASWPPTTSVLYLENELVDVGPSAVCGLYHSWHFHLTPGELLTVATKLSSVYDVSHLDLSGELILSLLSRTLYLDVVNIPSALELLTQHSDLFLLRGLLLLASRLNTSQLVNFGLATHDNILTYWYHLYLALTRDAKALQLIVKQATQPHPSPPSNNNRVTRSQPVGGDGYQLTIPSRPPSSSASSNSGSRLILQPPPVVFNPSLPPPPPDQQFHQLPQSPHAQQPPSCIIAGPSIVSSTPANSPSTAAFHYPPPTLSMPPPPDCFMSGLDSTVQPRAVGPPQLNIPPPTAPPVQELFPPSFDTGRAGSSQPAIHHHHHHRAVAVIRPSSSSSTTPSTSGDRMRELSELPDHVLAPPVLNTYTQLYMPSPPPPSNSTLSTLVAPPVLPGTHPAPVANEASRAITMVTIQPNRLSPLFNMLRTQSSGWLSQPGWNNNVNNLDLSLDECIQLAGQASFAAYYCLCQAHQASINGLRRSNFVKTSARSTITANPDADDARPQLFAPYFHPASQSPPPNVPSSTVVMAPQRHGPFPHAIKLIRKAQRKAKKASGPATDPVRHSVAFASTSHVANRSGQPSSSTIVGDATSRQEQEHVCSQDCNDASVKQIRKSLRLATELGPQAVAELCQLALTWVNCPVIMSLVTTDLVSFVTKYDSTAATSPPSGVPSLVVAPPPPPFVPSHFTLPASSSISGPPSRQLNVFASMADRRCLLGPMVNRMHELFHQSLPVRINSSIRRPSDWDCLIDFILRVYRANTLLPPTTTSLSWLNFLSRLRQLVATSDQQLWNRICSALEVVDMAVGQSPRQSS